MKTMNRFNTPVQEGEFIDIKNGCAHLLCSVEEWPDCPKGKSGYREVDVHGAYLKLEALQARVLNDRGFGKLESECDQSVGADSLEQDAFDCYINLDEATVVKVVTVTEFLAQDLPDGYYFVQFASPTLTVNLQSLVKESWNNFKLVTTNAKPSAGVATQWIDDLVKFYPVLDAPWLKDEIFTMLSIEEEPSKWDGAEHPFVGRSLKIIEMQGEPQYTGRTGVVTFVDDAGQIHGTWGGCALAEGDLYEFLDEKKTEEAEKPKDEPDPQHYNDGYIDMRVIDEFAMAVLTNSDGDCKTVGFDDNFFSPLDLVKAYRSLFKEEWGEDKDSFVSAFKDYLIATGCSAEEVEEHE